MAWTEQDFGNGKEKKVIGDNGYLQEGQLSPATKETTPCCISPVESAFDGKDALSYANILRSRIKFVDALAIYESMVEKDGGNVVAYIGKGICLQTQNMIRPAFESFSEAIKLDPHNACALTHCGILYKDEGQLVEATENYKLFFQELLTSWVHSALLC